MGEELTKAGTGTRHPLPPGGTATRAAIGTSSSSGETMTWGPCGTVIVGARNSSSSGGTSSFGGTMIEGPCRTGTSSSSSRTATGGPMGILPLAGISKGPMGPQQ
jgi:hypothetical protein